MTTSVRRTLAVVVTVLAASGMFGPRAHADTAIAPLAAATPIQAWDGVAVLSVRVGNGYRLATQTGREVPRVLPGIASTGHPFDANIGPGPSGAPVIVFARCLTAHRCRLMRTTLEGNAETAIPGSAGVNGYEHAPAVWGTRLAFARRFRNGAEHVYVRPLEAGTGVRSVRQPDVPKPVCAEACSRPPEHPTITITALALRGSMLAEDAELGIVEGSLCPYTEVRLVDVVSHRSRRIARSSCGLSGSTLVDVSLTHAYLLYARICPGDPGGCQGHDTLIYRYGLRDRRLEQTPRRDLLVGFAAEDDSHILEVSAPEEAEGGNCTNHVPEDHPPCELVRAGPIKFKPFRRGYFGA